MPEFNKGDKVIIAAFDEAAWPMPSYMGAEYHALVGQEGVVTHVITSSQSGRTEYGVRLAEHLPHCHATWLAHELKHNDDLFSEVSGA